MEQPDFSENQLQNTKNPPKNKKKIILIILLGLALLVLVAFLAFNYGSYMQRQEEPVGEAYEADPSVMNGLASHDELQQWKNAIFTIPEYNDIPVNFQRAIVKIFLDNKLYTNEDGNQHFFTKIKDRSSKVIAYGDYTGEGDTQMAFLLEKADFQSSGIFIITKEGNILYWKDINYELPTIKRFAKGALIYMDEMKLVRAPFDGIIKETKGSKSVLIYNSKTKTFDEYYQYTAEDIKHYNEEDAMDEEPTEDVDSTAVESE
ncbi:hypothetical protein [Elizabethkingia anophelis]|uniref:hypothetical protein n=1 Tax=Elizabethkingia anophelis TaxID=1117645 RepID=UPI00301D4041